MKSVYRRVQCLFQGHVYVTLWWEGKHGYRTWKGFGTDGGGEDKDFSGGIEGGGVDREGGGRVVERGIEEGLVKGGKGRKVGKSSA